MISHRQTLTRELSLSLYVSNSEEAIRMIFAVLARINPQFKRKPDAKP